MNDLHPRLRRSRLVPVVVFVLIVIAAGAAALAVRRNARADAARRQQLVMKSGLHALRSALVRYEKSHGHRASDLKELVRSGELAAIPADPVTGSSATWQTTLEESVTVEEFGATAKAPKPPEIVAIRSGARGADASGRRWSDY